MGATTMRFLSVRAPSASGANSIGAVMVVSGGLHGGPWQGSLAGGRWQGASLRLARPANPTPWRRVSGAAAGEASASTGYPEMSYRIIRARRLRRTAIRRTAPEPAARTSASSGRAGQAPHHQPVQPPGEGRRIVGHLAVEDLRLLE